jgi:hypothetical protein
MRNIVSIIFFLVIVIQAFGQKNWEEKFNGYVLTRDSVAVKGYLKFEVGDADRGTKINLYKKPNEKPQVFYSLELLGYAVKKDTFEILPNDHPLPAAPPTLIKPQRPAMVEAKVLCRGKFLLYEIQETSYALKPGTSPAGKTIGTAEHLATSPYEASQYIIYGIMDDEGIMTYVVKDDFIEKMKMLLHDVPDLVTRIENKELKFRGMEQIVKAYNLRFR